MQSRHSSKRWLCLLAAMPSMLSGADLVEYMADVRFCPGFGNVTLHRARKRYMHQEWTVYVQQRQDIAALASLGPPHIPKSSMTPISLQKKRDTCSGKIYTNTYTWIYTHTYTHTRLNIYAIVQNKNSLHPRNIYKNDLYIYSSIDKYLELPTFCQIKAHF